MKNRLIKVNNKEMEVMEKGEEGKLVLILTGMGCSMDEWFEVTETLSKTNKIVIFHRPGLGESEFGEEERTTSAVVNEMNELLYLLEVKESFTLMGHSYGGLCAQHFARLYPERVESLILVDSTSQDLEQLDALELPIMDRDFSDSDWLERYNFYASLTEEELRQVIQPVVTERQKMWPLHVQEKLIAFQQKPDLYSAMKSEISNWKKDAQRIKSLDGYLKMPLIVIGRDKGYSIQLGVEKGMPEAEVLMFEAAWEELVKAQADLSENSRLIFAESAAHSIHLDRPDLIVSAVGELVRESDFQMK